MSPSLRLHKSEKLCSPTAIESIFAPGAKTQRTMAYPWRAVWIHREPSERRRQGVKFVIMVPKKRLRHAVERVRMRRLMREAYRLNRHLITEGTTADLAIIYVGTALTDFAAAQRSARKILASL